MRKCRMFGIKFNVNVTTGYHLPLAFCKLLIEAFIFVRFGEFPPALGHAGYLFVHVLCVSLLFYCFLIYSQVQLLMHTHLHQLNKKKKKKKKLSLLTFSVSFNAYFEI